VALPSFEYKPVVTTGLAKSITVCVNGGASSTLIFGRSGVTLHLNGMPSYFLHTIQCLTNRLAACLPLSTQYFSRAKFRVSLTPLWNTLSWHSLSTRSEWWCLEGSSIGVLLESEIKELFKRDLQRRRLFSSKNKFSWLMRSDLFFFCALWLKICDFRLTGKTLQRPYYRCFSAF